MVWLRWPDPETGDNHQEMAPQEVVDFIAEKGQLFKFGVWEATDEQLSLEAEMVSKTNLLQVLQERQDDTLRLVPVIAGG
jgi:hypothetical protein